MSRDAKPGELREINLVEKIDKMARRTESRLDLEKALESLSPSAQKYTRHLITSGPSSIRGAARALEMKDAEVEAALAELEAAIAKVR